MNQNPAPAAGSFCWFELNTRKVDAVKEFYGRLCGWTTSLSPNSGFVYHHWLKDGVMFGGIMDMSSAEWGEMPAHWMGYIAVDDVDRMAARVAELGGNVCVPPTDIPDVGRFCVVNDPTGGTFSLIKVERPEPIAPTIVWNELMTRDAAKAAEFYTRLFGWTTESMPMGDAEYIVCNNAGQGLGGIFQMSGPQFENVPTYWLNYIGTDRIDADAQKVEALGGTIVVPPTDIPGNIGRFCVLCDPGGGHIALYQSMK